MVLFARCNQLDFMLKFLLLTGYIELGAKIFFLEKMQCDGQFDVCVTVHHIREGREVPT